MQLHEYPDAIAQIQYKLLNLNAQIEKISQSINRICNKFELKVAFDSELKNDSQRKAKKAELQSTSGDYEQLSRDLSLMIHSRDMLNIQLEELRNEFAVLKLLKRESIAKL